MLSDEAIAKISAELDSANKLLGHTTHHLSRILEDPHFRDKPTHMDAILVGSSDIADALDTDARRRASELASTYAFERFMVIVLTKKSN